MKDSYGWWSNISPCRIAAKNKSVSSESTSDKAWAVRDLNFSNLSAGNPRSAILLRAVRSSGSEV